MNRVTTACSASAIGVARMLALVGVFLPLGAHGPLACSSAVAASREQTSTVQVTARDGALSIEAHAASWREVLDEVSRATGTRFRVLGALSGVITLSVRNVPAAQALRHLLGPRGNYVFLFREAESRRGAPTVPSEVWVFEQRQGTDTDAAGGMDGWASRGADVHADVIQQMEQEFVRDPQAAREAALGSVHPEIRRRAVLHLGSQADQDALTVLAEVAQDREPSVRGDAVDALELFLEHPGMQRATLEVLGRLVDRHPRVPEILTHVLKTAEQAAIRQLAADSLGIPPAR